MRPHKFTYFAMTASIVLVLAFALPVSAGPPAPASETYTVMVGLENPHQGIGVNAYFPRSITAHVGDTVHWVQNSNEIHTVTFLHGEPLPPLILPAGLAGADPSISPLVFNPTAIDLVVPAGAQYDGSTFVNSGLMGREQGQIGTFDLTFVTAGTYDYLCVVHGVVMSGEVVVVSGDMTIPTPSQAMAEGKRQMASALAQVPAVQRDANEEIVPPTVNEDGTLNHHVLIGYSEMVPIDGGEVMIDLMQFFPDHLTVSPGDNVTFEMSPANDAPHTVTFLNGVPEPPLAIFQAGFLYVNKDVVMPPPLPPAPLTRTGMFNSGIMLPIPGTSYTVTIGDMAPGLQPYVCQLHDTSGMKGKLMVVPR